MGDASPFWCWPRSLRLPVVSADFESDDYLLLQHLEEVRPSSLAARGSWDLYRFYDGDVESTGPKIATGALPWWFDPQQKVAHFRPLSSFLLALDHRLFGLDPRGPHAHSWLWYVLTVGAAALFFRRTLPEGAALAATAVFALSSHSLIPTAWWAARHGLVSAAFGIAGLLAHVEWRSRGWRPGAPLSIVGLALSLLGGETGFQIVAFAIAYEIVEGRRLGGRVRGLLPPVALAAVALAARAALDYGVARSGVYVDPVRELPDYAANAILQLPATLAELLVQSEALTRLVTALGSPSGTVVLALAVAAVLLFPLRRESGVRWLALGALLSLALCFARREHVVAWTLTVPDLGIAALSGAAIAAASARGRVALAPGAALLLLVHGVAPAVSGVRALSSLAERDALASLPSPEDVPEEARRLVFVRNVEALPRGTFVLWGPRRDLEAVWTLSAWPGGFGAERADDRSLILTIPQGSLVPTRKDFFRDHERYPLAEGDVVAAGDLTVRVVWAKEGLVRRIECRWTEPIVSDSFAFLSGGPRRSDPFPIPAIERSRSRR